MSGNFGRWMQSEVRVAIMGLMMGEGGGGALTTDLQVSSRTYVGTLGSGQLLAQWNPRLFFRKPNRPAT